MAAVGERSTRLSTSNNRVGENVTHTQARARIGSEVLPIRQF